MFSIIITIIAIALVAALALATLYYGGDSFNKGGSAARASQIVAQGQQVLGAAELFRADRGRWPHSMEEMVSLNYLKGVPSVQSSLADAGAYSLTAHAQAAGGDVAWVMPKAGHPTFLLGSAVNVDVCRSVNVRTRGDDGILKQPHINLAAQCFGAAEVDLDVVITKEPGELATALAPVEVSTAAVPYSDLNAVQWFRSPSTTPASLKEAPPADAALALAPGVPTVAVEGSAYSFSLKGYLTFDGKPYYSAPVAWSVASGSLPSGLFLTSSGFISGVPTVQGTSAVRIRAAYGSSTIEQDYQITVAPLQLTLASSVWPVAKAGQAFSFDLKTLVSSNDAAFAGDKASFSATGLPSWANLSATGVLSGTPPTENEAGSNVQVQVTYQGATQVKSYTLVVNGATLQVSALAMTDAHTCAATPEGAMKCWGDDTFGQFGQGAPTSGGGPVEVPGLPANVVGVSTGIGFSCALTSDGEVFCMGKNDQGQLGNGTTTNWASATKVVGLAGAVVDLDSGDAHTCAVLANSTVQCWGQGNAGQLGDGSGYTVQTKPKYVLHWPVGDAVSVLGGIKKVVAGYRTGCALSAGGAVLCWGDDAYGAVGTKINGISGHIGYARQVVGISSGATAVDTGADVSCAIVSGEVRCWGTNIGGVLGTYPSQTYAFNPVTIAGAPVGGASVTAAETHACVAAASGSVSCWGHGAQGALGTGTTPYFSAPAEIGAPGNAFTNVYSAKNKSCARATDGFVKCWGGGTSVPYLVRP